MCGTNGGGCECACSTGPKMWKFLTLESGRMRRGFFWTLSFNPVPSSYNRGGSGLFGRVVASWPYVKVSLNETLNPQTVQKNQASVSLKPSGNWRGFHQEGIWCKNLGKINVQTSRLLHCILCTLAYFSD